MKRWMKVSNYELEDWAARIGTILNISNPAVRGDQAQRLINEINTAAEDDRRETLIGAEGIDGWIHDTPETRPSRGLPLRRHA